MSKKKILLSIVVAIIFFMIVSVVVSFFLEKNNAAIDVSEASSYPEYYAKIVAQKKPVFLFFYADWCSHCVNFMPTYNQLEKTYQGKYNFVKINIDSPENQTLVEDFYVTGIPTIYIVDTVSNKKYLIDNFTLQSEKSTKKELEKYIK